MTIVTPDTGSNRCGVSTHGEIRERRVNNENSIKLYNSLGHYSTNELLLILFRINESYYEMTLRNENKSDYESDKIMSGQITSQITTSQIR